jgi:hypothetical protein
LSGFVDFDVDHSDTTGTSSHCLERGLAECPSIGVEYFVSFFPFEQRVELHYFKGSDDSVIGSFPVIIQGTAASVQLPSCTATPENGICLSGRYGIAAIIGNIYCPTDRAPNDMSILSSMRADFDNDGDVDLDDVDHFEGCSTGPTQPQTDPLCLDADIDLDGDVDQADFGLLQVAMTGPT